jgi:hypothetical protein
MGGIKSWNSGLGRCDLDKYSSLIDLKVAYYVRRSILFVAVDEFW